MTYQASLSEIPGSKIEETEQSDRGNLDTGGQEEDVRSPLRVCRLVASYPHITFFAILSVHIGFAALSGGLILKGYNLFPVNFETLPMELKEGPWLKRSLAWEYRNEYEGRVVRTLPILMFEYFPAVTHMELVFIANSDIFTRENLHLMQKIEDRVYNISGFTNFCQLTWAKTCVKPTSVLRFFDGTYSNIDYDSLDSNFDNISDVLHAAYSRPESRPTLLYALEKNYKLNSTSLQASMTRSKIPFGLPTKGADSYESARDQLVSFMSEHVQPVLDEFRGDERLELLYYNPYLMIHEARNQAFQDMKLAGGSLAFIFLYVLLHTRSLWVTCLAVFSIACSFLETNLVYRVVLNYQYFGFFHIIAIFVILGIGVDDLFVFWDSWLAASRRPCPTLAHRLSEAYRNSATSMLVTSLTTMLAFAVNGLSPLLATSSFGVFAAVLVVVDYISVITFFPTVVVFYHLHFEHMTRRFVGFCIPRRKESDKNQIANRTCITQGSDTKEEECINDPTHISNSSSVAYLLEIPESKELTGDVNISRTDESLPESLTKSDIDEKKVFKTICAESFARPVHEQNLCASSSPQTTQNDVRNLDHLPDTSDRNNSSHGRTVVENTTTEKSPTLLVIFFSVYYLRFVTHKVIRWVVLAVFLGVLVTFCFFASRLQRDSEQIQFFKDSHHITRASSLLIDGFSQDEVDNNVVVYLAWGLKERNLSSCESSQLDCLGHPVYDDNFNASTEAAQQAFVNLCQKLKNITSEEAEKLAIMRNHTTGELIIACFTTNLEKFFKTDSKTFGLDVALPWNRNKTLTFMKRLSLYYDASAFETSSFSEYLEIPVNYWLFDSFRKSLTPDWNKFNPLIGEKYSQSSTRILTKSTITTANTIKYLAVAVTTNLKLETLAYTKHLPVLENWERFMEDQMSGMPQELQGGFQTTTYAWHWLQVQKALADNAIFGLVLGVSLSFPVLVLATCNILNGLLATFVIGSVTFCVVGIIPLAGWSMGVLVSLNLCLVAGLAVDYVVHLAEGYHMSKASDRHGRLRDALGSMGSSVLSGACSTLGASLFMLFAQIQFFFQFGVFMFCTIGFSLIFSLGLYTTLMGVMGPQGDMADIRALLSSCWTRMTRKSKSVSLSASPAGSAPLE